MDKVSGGVASAYTYDGEDILREVRGGSTLKYVHGRGVDEPLAVEEGGALSCFHSDHLGGIEKATNAAGVVTLTRRYDAWGNPELGASEPGYAFTGREWDPETGLYYYRARYYDPIAGRFITEDPVGLRDGINLFRYAGASPTNATDPSGTTCCRDCPQGGWYIDGGVSFGGAALFGGTVGLGNFVCRDRPWVLRRAFILCSLSGPIISLDAELMGLAADVQVQGKPAVSGITCSKDLYPYTWDQMVFQMGMYGQTDNGDVLFPTNKGWNLGGFGRGKIKCTAWPL